MMIRQLHNRADSLGLPTDEPSKHPLEVCQHESESLGPVGQVCETEPDAYASDVLSINRMRQVRAAVAFC